MVLNEKTKILIVGLGLIGGSYAEALSAKGFSVKAIDSRKEAVEYAVKKGIITGGSSEPDKNLIKEAELIVFALYPHIFLEWIDKYAQLITPGTVVTDVTGVKCSVVYRVQERLPEGVEFIASHPMAGREVYGVENSTCSIFKGANFVVTPTSRNTSEAVSMCMKLGEILGFARVSCLCPKKHSFSYRF